MKAITIQQPWANLLAIGAKRYETRSWATKYRGQIAIHAAVKSPLKCALGCGIYGDWGDAVLTALNPGWNPTLYSIEDELEDLPTGCIIATAELVNCWHIVTHPGINIDIAKHIEIGAESMTTDKHAPDFADYFIPSEQEQLFGDWTPGRYAWELAKMKMLPKPIPAKGFQGFWNWGNE